MDAHHSSAVSPWRQKWELILTVGLLILTISACSPDSIPTPTSPWSYDQIRVLDPASPDARPGDIIALYTRATRSELQIRIDLLELDILKQADIFIELTFAESSAGDLKIIIPAQGVAAVIAPQHINTPIPRVIRNPDLDTIIISLGLHLLPKNADSFSLHVYSTLQGEKQIQDTVKTSSDSGTRGHVSLLLAFWNTLPAHTPAQALRRWDGAHTGPLGRRHGLVHLLDAVERYRVPVVLLDLKTPLTLSVLELLDDRAQIQTLQSAGLVMLPDVLPVPYFGMLSVEINEKAASLSREIAQNFQFSDSPWNYAPALPGEPLTAYTLTLTRAPASMESTLPGTDIYSWGNQLVLPLPLENITTEQLTEDGLSLALRRELLASVIAANNETAAPIAVLGGNLPHTNWGDAEFAPLAIAYIAAHPWIHTLTEKELNSRVARSDYKTPTLVEAQMDAPSVLDALQQAPSGPIIDLAWGAALAFLAPADPDPTNLGSLRAHYLGMIGNLLTAAAWQRGELFFPDSGLLQDCSRDIDFDNQPECILATKNVFAIIDPQGGYISLAFSRTMHGVYQIIAPTSQFAVGLSDPSRWDLSNDNADPTVIPGALAGPWQPYKIHLISNGLRLTAASVGVDFTLIDHGILIDFQSSVPLQVDIPLAIDSLQRFTPGWAPRFEELITPQGWSWGTRAGPHIMIQTSGILSSKTFSASLPALQHPENPDFDPPPGYFLPLPMAVATIVSPDSFWVSISLLDNP